MMVGVLVAGTRSPTVRRPLSRKLSVLEILLAPECKYLQQSITNYNWFIMSLNHFVRCALKVSEPWLSALLKESPIISITERIHSVIERIPDYQHHWRILHFQHYWKDPRLSAATAESHRYPAGNSCCISSSTLGEHNNVEYMHSILVMCVVSHLRMLSLHMPCTL